MSPHPVLIEAPVLVPASALVAFGRSLLEKAEAAPKKAPAKKAAAKK